MSQKLEKGCVIKFSDPNTLTVCIGNLDPNEAYSVQPGRKHKRFVKLSDLDVTDQNLFVVDEHDDHEGTLKVIQLDHHDDPNGLNIDISIRDFDYFKGTEVVGRLVEHRSYTVEPNA